MSGRIRTVKPEWLEDERMASQNDTARVLSIVLILVADDASVKSQTAHIDHVIPRSRGGGDGMDNLATACGPCNTRKAAKTPEEWLA